MKKTLIDSDPLITLFDRNDKYHLASIDFIKNNSTELVTTLASVTETLHLLDFNRNAQIDFLGCRQTALSALRHFRQGKADYADALMGAVNKAAGCHITMTFDKKALRLEIFQPLTSES